MEEIAEQEKRAVEIEEAIVAENETQLKLDRKIKNLKKYEDYVKRTSEDTSFADKEFGELLKRYKRLIEQLGDLEQQRSNTEDAIKEETLKLNEYERFQAEHIFSLHDKIVHLQSEKEKNEVKEVKQLYDEAMFLERFSKENQLLAKMHLSVDNIYKFSKEICIHKDEEPSKQISKKPLATQLRCGAETFDSLDSHKKIEFIIQLVVEIRSKFYESSE